MEGTMPPPLVSTYAGKKKKRPGLPKFILADTSDVGDVFDSLNIEHIKSKKAQAAHEVPKRRNKVKKGRKLKPPVKPVKPVPNIDLPLLDSTFDRLLQQGPINNVSSGSGSSCGNSECGDPYSSSPEAYKPSSSYQWMRLIDESGNQVSRKGKRPTWKASPKKKINKLSLKYHRYRENRNSGDSRRKESVKPKEVVDKENTPPRCSPGIKASSALNVPSLQSAHLGSTSTPSGVQHNRMTFRLSPILCGNGSNSPISKPVEKSQSCNQSTEDMFKSFVENTNSYVRLLSDRSNSEQASINSASVRACRDEPDRTRYVARRKKTIPPHHDKQDLCCVDVCQSDISETCSSDNSRRLANCAENLSEDLQRCTVNLTRLDISAGNCRTSYSDKSSVENEGISAHVSTLVINTSKYQQDFGQTLQSCRGSKTRMDVSADNWLASHGEKSSVNENKSIPLSANVSAISETNSSEDLRQTSHCTEELDPVILDCVVNLTRMDISATEKIEDESISDSADLKKCEVHLNHLNISAVEKAENIVVKNKPLDTRKTSDSSLKKYSDAFSQRFTLNIPRQSILPTTDSVVLKPGKQWRRSLSMLSLLRASSSSGDKSVISRDSVKGKLWESSINNIHEMQSTRGLINENDERTLHSFECEETNDDGGAARAQVLSHCGQQDPVLFTHYYPASMKEKCKKIGEGVYGEVFMYEGSDTRQPAVIKIIPIEGMLEVNGEPQKKFSEILSEICIAKQLSDLRRGGLHETEMFNEVQAVRCVKGSYPGWLVDLWNDFDEEKGSENDSPTMFTKDQLFIVLELSHGGKDMESYVFNSAEQGLAAFKQILVALAVAEQALSFEHRDLHWGNVLITPTTDKDATFVLGGERITLLTKGIKVSIIDFTLSRIDDPSSLGCPIFYDLGRDETLFTATGDYQFEVYRLMKQFTRNDWSTYTPKTNVAWLHYLLDKFCSMARYRNRSSKIHKRSLDELMMLRDTVMSFDSATAFATCGHFRK